MKIIYALVFTFFSLQVIAQTGTVKGTITTSDGKPAEFVNVILEETGKGTVVDKDGNYTLHKVPAGSYTLVASFTGLVTQKSEVIVSAEQTVQIDFTLVEDNRQLQEVLVRGTSRMVNKESETVARMPLKNLENPQVYNVVSKELLKEQVVTVMTDALKAAPGVVAVSFPSGGIGVMSRGFATNVGARNGLQSDLGRSSADVSNIERIEFIKGPSGTLFGSSISSFGGLVNIVTKRPGEHFFGNVGLTVGSFGLSRLTADISSPLNNEKTVFARINTAIHRQNSFSDFGRVNSFAFAPSLLYKANEKLTVLFDAEIFNANSTRPTYTRFGPQAGITNYKDIPLDYRKSLYDNDLDSKTQSQKYFVEAKYKINENWTSSSNLSYVNELTDYSYQTYNTWITKDRVARYVGIWGPIKNTYINAQQNFVGKFNTGAVKHTLLAGVNYTNLYANGMSKSGPNFDTISVSQSYKLITKIYTDKLLLLPERVSSRGTTKNQYMGVYLSEVVNLSDRLYVMLSLRFDRFKQGGTSAEYEQNSVSPKLGLVYQLIKNKVSLFGNYMNGFQNTNPQVEQPDGSILNIKPLYANQWETGLKTEWLDGKVSATLSYYTINIDNALRTDDSRFTTQDGKQQSKGIELDVLANPVSGLNVALGYGYNENRIVKATLNQGNIVAGAPQNIATYWISYKFRHQILRNLGAGIGGNYASDAYFSDANTVTLPSYSVVNATLFYENAKWRTGIKLNNIGNTHYWDSYGIYNPTRNFSVDVAIKF
ncbi:Metal-pseudopaline receptor CntO [Dyadobacter sp. CECT 9275]|uniref:Metal-pseudopaline receptor CntO n=1 Tax=Dyadobacter helix TaxID=2822344 RepID=A0A916JD29_9BACT|nr:TonB-dependent receptor [Dyadobacter sp. CECT 9275]CAG5002589.1 Metal-pseudopaline receptor CntO [Dyadobacter sp. CECT 9275]